MPSTSTTLARARARARCHSSTTRLARRSLPRPSRSSTRVNSLRGEDDDDDRSGGESTVASPSQFATAFTRGLPEDVVPAFWEWNTLNTKRERKTHLVRYVHMQGEGPTVVLLHPFGGNLLHWRSLYGPLREAKCNVFAVDLLGLGGSEAPQDMNYDVITWASQCSSFVEQVVVPQSSTGTCVLVGTSITSLVALQVAADDVENTDGIRRVEGMCLMNCADGLNGKAVASYDQTNIFVLKYAAPILFSTIDAILNFEPFAKAFFQTFQTKAVLSTFLKVAYVDDDRVDHDLVDLFQAPCRQPGALNAFISVFTGDPGPTPMSLVSRCDDDLPLDVIWGEDDLITPVGAVVGTFFKDLPSTRSNTTFTLIEGAGHCPWDEGDDARGLTTARILKSVLRKAQ
ncbi:alpha/beta hydrolase domain-containing protein [Pycnococcus provasolii]